LARGWKCRTLVKSSRASFQRGYLGSPAFAAIGVKNEDKPTGVILSAADAGQNQRGWQLNITKASFNSCSPPAAPDNAIHLETKKEFSWRADGITSCQYDGSGKAAGAALYIDGAPGIDVLKISSGKHAHQCAA